MSLNMNIKLLTGDMMEIEVPSGIKYDEIYVLIREALPVELRPYSIHQMVLLLEGELVSMERETAIIHPEATYLLFIDPERYFVNLCTYHDCLVVVDRNHNDGGNHFIPFHFVIKRKVGGDWETLLDEWHLCREEYGGYIDLVDIEQEWRVRDDENELHISLPREKAIFSLKEMHDFLVTRVETLFQPSLAALRVIRQDVENGLDEIDKEWNSERFDEA
jgi:hypothetical protein